MKNRATAASRLHSVESPIDPDQILDWEVQPGELSSEELRRFITWVRRSVDVAVRLSNWVNHLQRVPLHSELARAVSDVARELSRLREVLPDPQPEQLIGLETDLFPLID